MLFEHFRKQKVIKLFLCHIVSNKKNGWEFRYDFGKVFLPGVEKYSREARFLYEAHSFLFLASVLPPARCANAHRRRHRTAVTALLA